MLQLWSTLWWRRGRGVGQRSKREKNSITHWWWEQKITVNTVGLSTPIAHLIFFILTLCHCFAAGVERKHQGSLQGAASSALWPGPVLLLFWIRVGQHMIHHQQYEILSDNWDELKLKVIKFCAFLYQPCILRGSGPCHQWCKLHRKSELILFYCCFTYFAIPCFLLQDTVMVNCIKTRTPVHKMFEFER